MRDFILFVIMTVGFLFAGCQSPVMNPIQNNNTNNIVSSVPCVVSVQNSGMRIINIVFDQTVDQISAETTTNYTIKNNKEVTVPVQSAKLLADTKTVQLFLSSGMYNDFVADSVEIKNVQDVTQTTTMNIVTKEFTMNDVSVPTVVFAEALGTGAFRVTFSEAIQGVAINAFKVDDVDSSIASVSYPDAGDYTKAIINLNVPANIGAHTLTVGINNTLTDYSTTVDGISNTYTMQPAGYVVTISANTSVPTLSSVEVLSQNRVRYTFSKTVQTPSENAFFWSVSSTATSGTPAALVTKVSDTVYEVNWSSTIQTGTIYFYAGTTTNKVIDYSGNSISPLPSSKPAVISEN